MIKTIKLFKETNEIQRVMALRSSRNKRHQFKQFIIEGRIAVEQANVLGWKIKSVFYTNLSQLSKWEKNFLIQKNYEIAYEISDSLMDKISDKSVKSGLIVIAEMKIRDFSFYCPNKGGVVVVVDRPKSAGNLGMMIRSAVAFGVEAIIISGHAADEYDPKCIRASVGTFFAISIYRVNGIRNFTKKIEELITFKRIVIIATGNKGNFCIENMKKTDIYKDLIFLILGNETTGVSIGYQQISNYFIHLPLIGKFTSLNIAAAGSIFLYEIFRLHKRNINFKLV